MAFFWYVVAVQHPDTCSCYCSQGDSARGRQALVMSSWRRGKIDERTPLFVSEDGQQPKTSGPFRRVLNVFGCAALLVVVVMATVSFMRHRVWDTDENAAIDTDDDARYVKGTDDALNADERKFDDDVLNPAVDAPICESCTRVCGHSNDLQISAIAYNTTWRAGLGDRQNYIEMLGQLGQILCTKVALMPPKLTLDPGHNDGDVLGFEWRWDLYFNNESLVEFDRTKHKPKPLFLDWRADFKTIGRLKDFRRNPGVEVFGDTPDTLTDSKILNDLSRAIELTKLGKPFFWQMNFEIAWGARYAYWQREYGDEPDRDMYAIDLTIIEGFLKEHGYLQRSDSNGVAISDGNLFLRDCRLAQVVTSTLAKKLADIVLLEAFGLVKGLGVIAPTSMTRQAGTGSGTQTLTRKMTTTNLGTPITITEDDEEKTRLAVIEHTSPQLRNKKFATLHVRRGDMLGWCDTDSEALRRFISCALSRSEDDEVNAGNVPILWFTDDDDETYQIEVTTALTEELTLYRSNFTGNLTGASEVLVIFGDALVNKVIEENLKAVARDVNVDLGHGEHGLDNYLIYQVGRVVQDRSSAIADSAWAVHYSYEDSGEGTDDGDDSDSDFSHGSCKVDRGDTCAEDGPILKMARGENVSTAYDYMLDVGNNIFLAGVEETE